MRIPDQSRRVVFTPARVDDLASVATEQVGRQLDVRFVGLREEGPYAGQGMWAPVDPQVMPGVAWIPDCDLTDA